MGSLSGSDSPATTATSELDLSLPSNAPIPCTRSRLRSYGKSVVENCQILQIRVNRFKVNKEDVDTSQLKGYSCDIKFTGPQYVCTNFSTFVCTTRSGIHREFTHRVKSVSMAKFTPQEVSALQGGGNVRSCHTFGNLCEEPIQLDGCKAVEK